MAFLPTTALSVLHPSILSLTCIQSLALYIYPRIVEYALTPVFYLSFYLSDTPLPLTFRWKLEAWLGIICTDRKCLAAAGERGVGMWESLQSAVCCITVHYRTAYMQHGDKITDSYWAAHSREKDARDISVYTSVQNYLCLRYMEVKGPHQSIFDFSPFTEIASIFYKGCC